MENKFESIEEKLALEVWMMQAFKLEDKILEEDLIIEDWMIGMFPGLDQINAQS